MVSHGDHPHSRNRFFAKLGHIVSDLSEERLVDELPPPMNLLAPRTHALDSDNETFLVEIEKPRTTRVHSDPFFLGKLPQREASLFHDLVQGMNQIIIQRPDDPPPSGARDQRGQSFPFQGHTDVLRLRGIETLEDKEFFSILTAP